MKKIKVLYLEDALEFSAHIAPSCSTHEYFGSSKYEALTPSHHGDMKNQYFERTPPCVSLREMNWRIRSTHEYYDLVQYEPKTPTHLRDTALLLFSRIGDL